MKVRAIGLLSVLFYIIFTMVPPEASAFVDISVKEQEVTYRCNDTIYVEALADQRWVTRYRATDGRYKYPLENWDDSDAFDIEMVLDPVTNESVSLTRGWQWVAAAQEKTSSKDVQHIVVELSHTQVPVALKVHTQLNEAAVMVRWLEITNNSPKAMALKKVSPWAGRLWMVNQEFSLGHFTRTNAGQQGWLEWSKLGVGKKFIPGNQGAAHDDPFFIVRNDNKGEYCIGHYAWTPPWSMEFLRPGDEVNPQPGLFFAMSSAGDIPIRVISAGETVTTGAIHLGHFECDLDAAVQAMHEHIRRFVLPDGYKKHQQLIQFCLPGDTAYLGPPVYVDASRADFNETTIKQSIDVAAAIGAEVFVLDAWWWEHSGDWIPSKSSLPNGLDPVIKHAKDKGMIFGLYLEPEGGRSDWTPSRVGREHPEWFLEGRNLINLTNPEAAEWVKSEICRVVEDYQVDIYRHDMNTHIDMSSPPTKRDGFIEGNQWRYYEIFYKMFEDIHAKYPELILQQAAGGSQRLDLGTVGRFHEAFVAEGGHPTVFQAYSGLTMALPPEMLAIGLGNDRNRGHLDTHLRTVYTLGTPFIISGVAPTLEELSDEHRERYLHYANIYKNFIRPILPTCKMYHHAPVSWNTGVQDSPWFAVQFVSPDKKKGWATIARLGMSDSDTYVFHPRGFDFSKTYKITFDGINTVIRVDGMTLFRDGLPIRLETALSSELLLFEVDE